MVGSSDEGVVVGEVEEPLFEGRKFLRTDGLNLFEGEEEMDGGLEVSSGA